MTPSPLIKPSDDERKARAAAKAREKYASDREHRERSKERARAHYGLQMELDPEGYRAKRAAQRAAQRAESPAKALAARKKYRAIGTKRAREYVRALKTGVPCSECGGVFSHVCMDFDHVRGEKKYNIGSMVGRGLSPKLIDEEVAKCELVCSNCHRIRTYARMQMEGVEMSEANSEGVTF